MPTDILTEITYPNSLETHILPLRVTIRFDPRVTKGWNKYNIFNIAENANAHLTEYMYDEDSVFFCFEGFFDDEAAEIFDDQVLGYLNSLLVIAKPDKKPYKSRNKRVRSNKNRSTKRVVR